MQHQLDVMQAKFRELRHLLTSRNTLLAWRLQQYVTGVLTTALHNVGGWLLDPRTQRKLNGVNSRLLAQITGRSVYQEAAQPTLCAVQWARTKRARWLGHILREDGLSLVRAAIFESHASGEQGTLMDEAPPHRSLEHLRALASKGDNYWEDWCRGMHRTICPKTYDGLARASVRQSLRRGRRRRYDPVPPTVIVPPPEAVPDTTAAPSGSANQPTLSQRWDAVFAEALAEVNDKPIQDPLAPADFFTDGSCNDNGKPWAAAGWGVCVENSAELGEFFGAVPGQIQTNNRAELTAVEAALQLAWNSTHFHCRIFADCNLACLAISNDTEEWSWRKALGVDGWLDRWLKNGWRTASGARVSHTDLWKRILRWLRLFESAPNRCVEMMHVRAHAGTKGNERADALAKRGSKLRFDLMELETPDGWFTASLERYWQNRRPE